MINPIWLKKYQFKKGHKSNLGKKNVLDMHWKVKDSSKMGRPKGYKHTEEWRVKMSETMKGKNNWSKGRKLSEEHKKKIGEAQKGEKNHFWKGGISNRKRDDRRNDSAYNEWVRLVKSRDNWKCRINNKDCKGKVVAHHILPWRNFPELRYEINNGITLCQSHHPRVRTEEKRLIPFFTGLVPVLKEVI